MINAKRISSKHSTIVLVLMIVPSAALADAETGYHAGRIVGAIVVTAVVFLFVIGIFLTLYDVADCKQRIRLASDHVAVGNHKEAGVILLKLLKSELCLTGEERKIFTMMCTIYDQLDIDFVEYEKRYDVLLNKRDNLSEMARWETKQIKENELKEEIDVIESEMKEELKKWPSLSESMDNYDATSKTVTETEEDLDLEELSPSDPHISISGQDNPS